MDSQARAFAQQALGLANKNSSNLHSYVLNIDKGLRNWNVAKAKAPYSSTPPCVVVLGDSITDATGATNYNTGYSGLLRNAIQMSTGLSGYGFSCNHQFSPDGTWTQLKQGTNLTTWKGTPTSTAVSFKQTFASIDVIYSKATDGGTFTVKVDGIANTINCNGSASSHNVATFTFPNAPHTIEIDAATSGNTYIEGVICRTGNNGMLVHTLGHPGIRATDYTNNSDIVASTSAFNPQLTIIMLGTNDAYNQVSLSTYQSCLDAIVKQALTTGDVLVMAMGDQSGATYTIPYSSYVNTAKQVAINNNCAFLSIYDRWQQSYTWANNNGLMYDNLHPSQSGHADIAEAIREVLGIAYPVFGVFQLYSDSQIPYGDIKMMNVGGNFRLADMLQGGLHAGAHNVSVTSGASSITINNTTPDSSFSVSVAPSWNTTWWITGKSYAGFTVNFGTAAPTSATIDWEITR